MIIDLLAKHGGKAIPRTLSVSAENVVAISHSDHHFDALLCALTAWSHHHNHTVSWQDAKIPKEIVNQEGHISLLRTDDSV